MITIKNRRGDNARAGRLGRAEDDVFAVEVDVLVICAGMDDDLVAVDGVVDGVLDDAETGRAILADGDDFRGSARRRENGG